MSKTTSYAVYGGGGWGCALACQIARVQPNVKLLLRDDNIIAEINQNHTNKKYLGDVILPNNILPTNDINNIIDSEFIVIAVPSYSFADALDKLKAADINKKSTLLIATKGISAAPVQLLSDKLKFSLTNPFAFIAGPNFAREVASNHLTAVTIAAEDISLAKRIAQDFSSEFFETNVTDDIITIQIAGAIKNIIAIKSGMYEALGFKENAKAALITKAIKEIMILSQALGGHINSVTQAAVIGDLVLTCYSKTSRNTKFGFELALSPDQQKFLKNYPYLIEGREAAGLVLKLANQHNIKLPLVESVAKSLEY